MLLATACRQVSWVRRLPRARHRRSRWGIRSYPTLEAKRAAPLPDVHAEDVLSKSSIRERYVDIVGIDFYDDFGEECMRSARPNTGRC